MSLGSVIPPSLLNKWSKWDERVLVLFSLFLQIVLSVLGRRRMHIYNSFVRGSLWAAYVSADWIALSALGMLSRSIPYIESATTKSLRVFWAPLLILHLGGPDSITSCEYEDNKLWSRHLLVLIAKSVLAIYVICLSWTSLWISILNIPLLVAALIKYAERIWCLQWVGSQKTGRILNIFERLHGSRTVRQLDRKHSEVFIAYLVFSETRPDLNKFSFRKSKSAPIVQRKTMLRQPSEAEYELAANIREWSNPLDVAAQMGEFLFDTVYTKRCLVYTWLGCLLRLTSFVCFLSVLLVFFIGIVKSDYSVAGADIYITSILFCGAFALELFSVFQMLSSRWSLIVAFYQGKRVYELFSRITLRLFPCLSSNYTHMKCSSDYNLRQFDMLEYCCRYKKKETISLVNDIIEMRRKSKFVRNIEDDSSWPLLKQSFIDFYFLLEPVRGKRGKRGKRAITQRGLQSSLGWAIEDLDFDHSILVWHLATSVCYYQMDTPPNEAVKISKWLSDYMMYLLVMRPSLLFTDQTSNFWIDNAPNILKDHISPTADTKKEASTMLLQAGEDKLELRKNVSRLASNLNSLDEKWETIKEVWVEILVTAALQNNSIHHVKHLAKGAEFLSLVWLLLSVYLSGFNYLDKYI